MKKPITTCIKAYTANVLAQSNSRSRPVVYTALAGFLVNLTVIDTPEAEISAKWENLYLRNFIWLSF